ncbi:MAG: zf-HC2 domain-containing protein [Anaerolineae bacterium]|nr:zf-HC2 domain-containing protein [Anaerolineae bacterium]MEB2286992.1 zf-HC2 domain-containing protein [Anaerolineae bacterium]
MSASDQPHEHNQDSCRRYLSSLSEYADGTLSAELCEELEAHMAICENCRIVVNTLTRTVSLYRQIPAPKMPSAVKERLYKVLHLEAYIPPGPDAPDQPGQ